MDRLRTISVTFTDQFVKCTLSDRQSVNSEF